MNLTGCARFSKPSVLLDSEVPVYLKKGQAAPHDGIFMQDGYYVKLFEKCAEKIPK